MHLTAELSALLQVLIIDISLAGDNAVVIGMAANGLPAAQRRRAIWLGLGGATILRILLAIFAVQLLHIAGLTLAGGLLLLWVSWKMYRDLHGAAERLESQLKNKKDKTTAQTKLRHAIVTILLADLGMSLDNILAVAGAARDHYTVLALGLVLSVLLMGLGATLTAKLLQRWPALAWIGMAVVLFVALRMIWDGTQALSFVLRG